MWSTFPSVMAGRIAQTRSREIRRAMLESVPEEYLAEDLRARVRVLTVHMFRRR